jgi:uncharacterized protein (TIGR03437 family)
VAATLFFLSSAGGLAQTAIGNIIVTLPASFQVGLPFPGSIATLFCTGLQVDGVVAANSVPLPFSLAGVTVTVDGAPAPLFAVATLGGYQQINFQVPMEASVSPDAAAIVVQQNGVRGSGTAQWSYAPDLFVIPGTQDGIFQHGADFTLVTKDHPARPGEILVAYLTGLIGTSPTVPTGEPAPFQPLATFTQVNSGIIRLVQLVANGDNVINGDSLLFLGLSPGSVGLYQVNFVLPAGLAAGAAEIKVEYVECTPIFAGCGPPPNIIRTHDSAPVLLPVGGQ